MLFSNEDEQAIQVLRQEKCYRTVLENNYKFSLLVSGLMVDILSTYCDGFVVHCVKLMRSKFLQLWLLLFDSLCLSLKCNDLICLKHFTRYGHYAREVEDIIIARLAIVS